MPANLSPEYKTAEAAFKQARDAKERLDCLREMLRAIPKHKGTEHLQADIKTRIKNLAEELSGPRKGGARGGPPLVIRREGAAQVALIGAANAGKSTLHARATGSHAEVGPYPGTTRFPLPGMLPHENIHFQLVDLPPISRERPVPWIGNALQPAHACLLVVDTLAPDSVDQFIAVHDLLAEKRVSLLARWQVPAGGDELDDPFAIRLPALLVANKIDRVPALQDDVRVLQELSGTAYPVLAVSALTGEGVERLGPWLFEALGIVRVYTKAPGRPPDKGQPFTVRRGETVRDVAALVHRDIAASLRYARLWRDGQRGGRQVGRDHPVADGDILELHA